MQNQTNNLDDDEETERDTNISAEEMEDTHQLSDTAAVASTTGTEIVVENDVVFVEGNDGLLTRDTHIAVTVRNDMELPGTIVSSVELRPLDGFDGLKSGEEIGHLMQTTMKSSQSFRAKIGLFGFVEFNQARFLICLLSREFIVLLNHVPDPHSYHIEGKMVCLGK